LVFLLVLGVAVKVHVDHDIPCSFPVGDRSAQTEDFTSEEPPDETYRMAGFVVCRNSNINVLKGRVCVAEGNDGNGHLGAFLQRLVVCSWVGCDDKTGLYRLDGHAMDRTSLKEREL
jgi:hypothetical protein